VLDPFAGGKRLLDVSEALIDMKELAEIIGLAKEAFKNSSL